MVRRRKHWGWGYEDQQPDHAALEASAATICERLGLPAREPREPVGLEQLALPLPRIEPPRQLAAFSSAGSYERAAHALGKSYVDVVRGFSGDFAHPPDFVCFPRAEFELEQAIEWCSSQRVAAIPFGGGTSVVGGVTPELPSGYNGAVSIDMGAFDRVLEVDPVSRSALIGAGATGPSLEAQLASHGLTLRHYPQSFEFSTLGGWIATRAGGHFATLWTHIEDMLESVRALTPAGAWESRRLPGSGAGVSPDRMLAGSEGVLGVITRAWMRVQPRPRQRSSVGVRFADFAHGAQCVRAISQSGLHPSNLRLLDAGEAALTGAGDGSHALLALAFEGVDHPVSEAMGRAREICREHGGVAGERDGASDSGGDAGQGAGAGGVGSWRSAFLGAPYLRDVLVAIGVMAETFETAITWERFDALHERVIAAAHAALGPEAAHARVQCRFTHVYPDGPAPYFTVIAPARRGSEIEQWLTVKAAVSDAIVAAGGTITHHHAVGRDHRPWYDQQRPELFAAALGALKATTDPAGVMNPGVLIDPLA
jgi:alkyldihydroxyacetonephosphate synthase